MQLTPFPNCVQPVSGFQHNPYIRLREVLKQLIPNATQFIYTQPNVLYQNTSKPNQSERS